MLLKELWCLLACLMCAALAQAIRRDRASDREPIQCGMEISSTATKNGTFTSLNYPEPYPKSLHCVYTFVGQVGERVQIAFTDFDLHLPHEQNRNCDSFDAVMVFITINGRRERLENFCGNKLPEQLMSNGPSMIVEFRSYHSSQEVKGFRAIYRFVKVFSISGCEFTFLSEERSNGTFSSPNYPGFYPRETECTYIFQGKEKERVQITFTSFDVDGVYPCEQETASDYVEFSNFKTTDRKMSRICGNEKKAKYVESETGYFRIVFKSNEKFDGTGFEAFYQFKKQEDPSTVKRISITSANNSSVGNPLRMDAAVFYILPALLYASYYLRF
ncbi:suppressor of lurcher protein 1-like [Uloborus diversus]|uniref:suppressor of lurcher protein 1-like n=1 Tax=Uloborus diversus TaxID=327109 RepID=UPI00240A3071|nr:suppressor of lurcher protein 1-like [Uloborus diversus]